MREWVMPLNPLRPFRENLEQHHDGTVQLEEDLMSDIYQKLRERLDMFPQGFPETESGVELEILRDLFSPEEAEIMLSLRPSAETVSAVAERMGRDEKELGERLYDMSKRGLILRFRASEEQVFYFLAPWVVGMWEFQLKNLNSENIQRYEKYHNEAMVPERRRTKTAGFRVIPVEEEVKANPEVETSEMVSEIIESSTRFAVADCICRKEAQMFGHACDRLMEACMMFDMAADYYVENELAREITKEEAERILEKAEEDGLVHHSSNHLGKRMFICNCCGCCCKALGFVTKHGNPDAIARSNYYAVIDQDECTSCEVCVDRCQVDAIQMEDDVAVADREACIGCGLCISTCPTECISLTHKTADEASPIFADDTDLLQTVAKDKNKEYPFQ
jgi:NAD-dependent dihydropyrimidine dehydrogenase PreA subunit/predicted transcriptional regulator